MTTTVKATYLLGLVWGAAGFVYHANSLVPQSQLQRCQISGRSHQTSMSAHQVTPQHTKVQKLRELLSSGELYTMPCCYDGLTARLIESAGFPLTFMTGFGVSASNGIPDTGLISYGCMLERAQSICSALQHIPCIGDADTGYGNHLNTKRTVRGYAQVGMAGIMIEDQVAPKRCGHTKGKLVINREQALMRIKAAVDARNEGADIVILARTDAREILGMDEAIERCKGFMELGADITFLEAPQSREEMERYCREVPGPKLANMLEFGRTPILPPQELKAMGYTIAAYPISLLSASIKAMNSVLESLKNGESTEPHILKDFKQLQDFTGFTDYHAEEERYRVHRNGPDLLKDIIRSAE